MKFAIFCHIMNGEYNSKVAQYCSDLLTSKERKTDLYSLELVYD